LRRAQVQGETAVPNDGDKQAKLIRPSAVCCDSHNEGQFGKSSRSHHIVKALAGAKQDAAHVFRPANDLQKGCTTQTGPRHEVAPKEPLGRLTIH
jgi:hypothetical protein